MAVSIGSPSFSKNVNCSLVFRFLDFLFQTAVKVYF